ncbi:MAG: DMT family transporter [Pseudomonadota bacterium]
MPLGHLLVIALVNVIWGTNLVLTKVALLELPPLTFAALRFALILAVLAPLLKPVRGEMGKVMLTGLTMGALHFTLIYVGLQRAEDIAGIAIATQLYVPFATILSILFLGERIGWRRTLGISLAFGGVAWMSFDPKVFADLDALVLVSGGAMMGAAGTIMMKRIRGARVFQLQAWIAAVSFPLLTIASVVFETGQREALVAAPIHVYAILVFSALGASLIGHGGMYWLLQRHDVSVISPTTIASTFIGIGLGVVLLNEVLTLEVVIGGAISLLGVLIVALRQPRRGPTPPAAMPPILPRRQRR